MFLAICCTFHFAFAQNVEQRLNESATRNLETALDENGKIKPGINGSFDAQRYEMGYDKNGEPVFKKINSLNKTETVTCSVLGSPINGISGGTGTAVNAIAVVGTDVYVGGYFTSAGGVSASNIAKWDGSSWAALGAGVNGSVQALAYKSTNHSLYVGGSFTSAGGSTANRIAYYNTSTGNWGAIGTGMNNTVLAIASPSGVSTLVYAGGAFTTAGGITANYLAAWDGSNWTKYGGGTNGIVRAITYVSSSEIYVGGDFTTVGSSPVYSLKHIARRFTNDWEYNGVFAVGIDGNVHAIAVSGTTVYVGGDFNQAGGAIGNYIAKYDFSTGWSALGTGMASSLTPSVKTIKVYGTDVYVGGYFSSVDGVTASGTAKWNGTSWSALANVGTTVNALAVNTSASQMMVGGDFTAIGGVSANHVASFTDSGNPLPVEITSFTANTSDNKVILNWQSATEQNNYGFEIERQANPNSRLSA